MDVKELIRLWPEYWPLAVCTMILFCSGVAIVISGYRMERKAEKLRIRLVYIQVIGGFGLCFSIIGAVAFLLLHK